MLAAKLIGVPIRMHTVAGLPLLEATGVKRKILNFVERLTSWSATNVYPNSFALKEIMIKEKLAPQQKLKVIANGSSNGIDTEVFDKEKVEREKLKVNVMLSEMTEGNVVETSLGMKGKDASIPLLFTKNDVIFCFVGRIVKDKGIDELLYAFDKLSKENNKVKLLLVGSEEKELDPIGKESQLILRTNKQIVSVGWQEDIRPFLAISNVFVFPSYREGFPNVVMQAGAMELPSIVTNINGSNEIIKDGVNGLIIPVKDKKALFDKMKLLSGDSELRNKLAKPARRMIVDRYEQEFVWEELLKEYRMLLEEKGIDLK